MNIDEIRGAVARGWCSPENSHKEMDATLALAIADEVYAIVRQIEKDKAGMVEALTSMNSACCGDCQEAKRVALDALVK
jgi:hypothetical protein